MAAVAIAAVALGLFGFAWLRHALFWSGAFDLGIFDQAVYLISRGLPPVSSFMGFPILGDHAALVLYLIAPLYWVHAGPATLFALQAVALASGAYPVHRLAIRHLDERAANTFVLLYLLSPIVFNANAFDFHPDTLALPGLLWALEAAEAGSMRRFAVACVWVLSCKEVLSLTVLFLGVRLLCFRDAQKRGRKAMALLAMGLGGAWFVVSTQIIIPRFSGHEVAALSRYAYLGHGFAAVAFALVLDPWRWLPHVLSLHTVGYLAMLLLPVAGGLALGSPLDLLPAVPALMLNVLSEAASQTDVMHQYAIPILPFLLVAAMRSPWTREMHGLLTFDRWARAWALAGFVLLAKWIFLFQLYLPGCPQIPAIAGALARVDASSPVLTSHEIAPHLADRQEVAFYTDRCTLDDPRYHYVLVDLDRPSWETSRVHLVSEVARLRGDRRFQLIYREDGVLLFSRSSAERSSTVCGVKPSAS